MSPINLLMLSVALYGVAALISLLLRKSDAAARVLSGLIAMAAAVIGCMAAAGVFVGGAVMYEAPSFSALGHFVLRVDSFSALMVGIISVLAFAASLYSISYVKEYDGRGTGELGFFNNLFIAAMLLVVAIANG